MTTDAEENCCYLCNECGCNFASLEDLEAHMGSAHAVENTSPPVSKVEDVVDAVGSGSGSLQGGSSNEGKHSPSSSDSSMIDGAGSSIKEGSMSVTDSPEAIATTGGLVHLCRFCNKTFGNREQLNIHYTHTHRDKPQYECEVCFKVFSVKRELATHRRVHSGEQTHVCAQCGKEFGTRQLLKKHWMWHTGERSHVCPHCGKAFFQKGHLTQHLMIHAGGRPHVCHLCQKTFIFKFDLNRHMKIHAERGYSCDKCGRAFLKHNSLIDHAAKCRGNVPAKTEGGATPMASSPSSRCESASSTPTMVTSAMDVTPRPLQIIESAPEDPPSKTPPAVAVQQQQQRQLVANLVNQQPMQQMAANQPPPATTVSSAFPPQQFFCFLCMRPFASQAAYTLHLSFVHFRNAMFPQPQQQQPPQMTPTMVQNEMPTTNGDTSSVTPNLSPTSPLTTSTLMTKTELPSSENQAASNHQQHQCDCGCALLTQRSAQLERALALRETEVQRLKEVLNRVSGTAGGLLESCTDFDKLWMLHSKKVYTQIQSILNQSD